MTLPLPELIAEMEAGLEGVTPGPWSMETVRTSCGVCHKIGPWPHKWRAGETMSACIYDDYPSPPEGTDTMLANATHLARCSPDNIAAIIAGYRQLQKENADLREDIGACHATFAKPIDILNDRVDARDAEISALKALLREATAALEPFAEIADTISLGVADKHIIEGAWNGGVFEEVRVGDFRRARFVAAHIKKGLPDGE